MLAILAVALAGSVPAQRLDLPKPGDRKFVLDVANVLSESEEDEIREICDPVLSETAVPIIVVTIRSMAEHGGSGWRIETFARVLFDQWGIGHETIGGQEWNRGILLLVSIQDRKARIELGAGWRRGKDEACAQIMQELIVPRFRSEDFPGGVKLGVEGLAAMARGLEIPAAPTPWWHYALWVGFIALAIFTAVSLARRGASGWAWFFWAALFSFVGYMLYAMMTTRGGGGSGGGFSGGSFGGGFSGGGGATGSW